MSAICFPEPERETLPLSHSPPGAGSRRTAAGLTLEGSPVYSNLSSPSHVHLNGEEPPRAGSAAAPTSGSESIASPKLVSTKPMDEDGDPDDQPPCLAPADEDYHEGKSLLGSVDSPPDDPPVINGLGPETEHILSSGATPAVVAAIAAATNGRSMVMGLPSCLATSPKLTSNGKVKQQRQQPATGKVHWSVERTLVLLDLVETNIERFGSSRTQRPLWKEIASKFCARFNISTDDVNGDHCYNKWKNLRRDLRDQRHSEKATRNPSIMTKVANLENLMLSRGGPHHGGGRNGVLNGSKMEPLVSAASLLDIKMALKDDVGALSPINGAGAAVVSRGRLSLCSQASTPPQPPAPPKKRPRRDLIADLPLMPGTPGSGSAQFQQQHQLQVHLEQQHQEQQQQQQQQQQQLHQLQQQHHQQQQQLNQQQHNEHHMTNGQRRSPGELADSPPELYGSGHLSDSALIIKREDSPGLESPTSLEAHHQLQQHHQHQQQQQQRQQQHQQQHSHAAHMTHQQTSPGSQLPVTSSQQTSPAAAFGLSPELLLQLFHGMAPLQQQQQQQQQQPQQQHQPQQHLLPNILTSLASSALSAANANGGANGSSNQEALLAAAAALLSSQSGGGGASSGGATSGGAPVESACELQWKSMLWTRALAIELGRWGEMEGEHEVTRQKMRQERRDLAERHEAMKRRLEGERRQMLSRVTQVVALGSGMVPNNSTGAPGRTQ